MAFHTCLSRFLLLCLSFTAGQSLSAQNHQLDKWADEAEKAWKKKQWERVDSLHSLYVSTAKREGHDKSFAYGLLLSRMVKRQTVKKQFDEAIKLQEEVIQVMRTAPDSNNSLWASAVSDLSQIYAQKGDFTKAISIAEEALEIYRKCFGEKHHYYSVVLSNIARFYSDRDGVGDIAKAVEYGEMALKNIQHNTRDYAFLLSGLAVYYSQIGDMESAGKYAKKARKEGKSELRKDPVGFAMVLNNSSIQLARLRNYHDAIEFAEEAKELLEESGQQGGLNYCKLLTNLATFHRSIHQYDEAVALLEQNRILLEQHVSKNHSEYVRCVSELSSTYRQKGDLEKADEYAHETDHLVMDDDGNEDNIKHIKSLSRQASAFAANGNYPRAIEREQKAMELYLGRNDSLSYSQSKGRLALYLLFNNEDKKALKAAEECVDFFSRRKTLDGAYAQALNEVSVLYYNMDDMLHARTYGKQAIDIYEKTGETSTVSYAKTLANMGLFLSLDGNFDEAINYTKKAYKTHQELLGEDHPDNVLLAYNLANFYSHGKHYEEAEKYYEDALQLQMRQVRNNFLHLTAEERERYWNHHQYVFLMAPHLAYNNRENKDILTDAYDAMLFNKGVLLNAEIDLRNLLLQTGKNELLEKFNRLMDLYEKEKNVYRQGGNVKLQAKAIKEKAYQLERELVKESKEYGNFTENLSISFKEVSRALQSQDAAVEFSMVELENGANAYLALYTRKDWEHPRLLVLFSENDLNEFVPGGSTLREAMKNPSTLNAIYDSKDFGTKVWEPLMEALGSDVKNIYFSPAGIIHNLGIEYLICNNQGQRANEVYHVFRLSSTKFLAQKQHQPDYKTAIIYGGLKYNMTLQELQDENENIMFLDEEMDDMLLAMDTSGLDDQWDVEPSDRLRDNGDLDFLQYSLQEAESVENTLSQGNVVTRLFTGTQGTEETFKWLHGKHISIIHIATHGFAFHMDDLKAKGQKLAFLSDGEETNTFDDYLNYSGLMLSGARYKLNGGTLPAGLEDGVLTAKEISRIDLSGADLVTLSACQTGLGEVKDEGVFGLQRGFKKAGAKTLLMSLWNVSDQATKVMMSAFYQGLMDKKSKYKAFTDAQQAVRDAGFNQPFYWASFVLLDAY